MAIVSPIYYLLQLWLVIFFTKTRIHETIKMYVTGFHILQMHDEHDSPGYWLESPTESLLKVIWSSDKIVLFKIESLCLTQGKYKMITFTWIP